MDNSVIVIYSVIGFNVIYMKVLLELKYSYRMTRIGVLDSLGNIAY
jgi:hypothetical protein